MLVIAATPQAATPADAPPATPPEPTPPTRTRKKAKAAPKPFPPVPTHEMPAIDAPMEAVAEDEPMEDVVEAAEDDAPQAVRRNIVHAVIEEPIHTAVDFKAHVQQRPEFKDLFIDVRHPRRMINWFQVSIKCIMHGNCECE